MATWTERETFVRTMMDIASDFSDGAFWGFMEEKGISTDEVMAVSKKLTAERAASNRNKED